MDNKSSHLYTVTHNSWGLTIETLCTWSTWKAWKCSTNVVSMSDTKKYTPFLRKMPTILLNTGISWTKFVQTTRPVWYSAPLWLTYVVTLISLDKSVSKCCVISHYFHFDRPGLNTFGRQWLPVIGYSYLVFFGKGLCYIFEVFNAGLEEFVFCFISHTPNKQ